MGRIKQSFCLGCFRNDTTDIKELVGQAKSIGLSAAEMWFRQDEPFQELVGACNKHGLVFASMCGHRSLEVGLNDPAEHDRIEDELLESIEVAAENQIPGLIVFSGNRGGAGDDESVDICAQGLRRVIRAAEDKGINLNMELLNSKRDHPGYQCDHTEWGVRVCKAVDSPRAKLLYDIYHMAIMEGDLIATIRANMDYIGHMHTAGNPGRGPLDENQEIYYPAVCRAIADAGYDLYMGHEFGSGQDPVGGLKAAYEVCDV
jgi:hydroxypyruvate isomerase